MASKQLGVLTAVIASLIGAAVMAHAGDDSIQKELDRLNQLTGSDTRQAVVQKLLKNQERAKKLIQAGLPSATKKEMAYEAALILAMAAADLKEMKASETYFRVCMDKAAKLQSFEKLTESYIPLIRIYYDYKQYADSARICKELLELNTEDGKERIVIRTMTDRFGEAGFREEQDGFQTAARLRPYVRENYIKALAKQGKHDQAIKMVDGLVKQKNGDWRDQYLQGWVYNEAGRFDESAKIYERVIGQVDQDNRLEQDEKEQYISQFRYEAANIYVDLKNIDRATEHFEYLLKKNPNNPVYYNDLGYIWADHDMKLEEAEKLIRKAIDLHRDIRKKAKDFDPKTDHDSGAFLDSLGWVLYKQKKNAEAKEWLLKAIEDKSSWHIEIYDHLGDVHVALGERDLALKAWRKGLEHVNPGRRDQERKVSVEKKIEKHSK